MEFVEEAHLYMRKDRPGPRIHKSRSFITFVGVQLDEAVGDKLGSIDYVA